MKKSITAILLLLATIVGAGQSPAPLITAASLEYLGSFLPPAQASGGFDLAYGGRPIAFNPANRSLFIGTLTNRVTEITIPKAGELSSFIQPIVDPTDGRLSEVSTSSVGLYGLLIDKDRLHFTAATYYDANNTQRLSHGSRSTNLASAGTFSGWSAVWRADRSGFVAGWMDWVPQQYRAALGGPAITGNGALPIISRTSHGPAAFAFDPALIGQKLVPASPLAYYPIDHATLGGWENQGRTPNLYFNQSTQIGGMVIVGRSALFVGRQGIGPPCYGHGVKDKALHGAKAADGVTQCYDLKDGTKGSHAYPYRYQIWAYDLNDFAAVKAGKRSPWDIKPYALIPLPFIADDSGQAIGGAAYDVTERTLYVSQLDASPLRLPLIHAIKVNAGPIAPSPALLLHPFF